MPRFSDIRIRPKLIFLFMVTGVLPLMVVGWIANGLTEKALLEKSFNQLISVQALRKGQFEDFFVDRCAGIGILAGARQVEELLETLKRRETATRTGQLTAWEAESEVYRQKVEPFEKLFENYLKTYEYQEVFIIDGSSGEVLFTMGRGKDLGTNLVIGKYRNSGLAKAWRTAVSSKEIAITDFSPYEPADGEQAMFIASPIWEGGSRIGGVLAFQLSPELITRIVDARQGMGETGESYLLHMDLKKNEHGLRSNMKTMGEGEYVVGRTLDQTLDYWRDAAKAGMKGGHAEYADSRGRPVLVAYNQLHIKDLSWYLISKIDRHEVTEPVRRTYRIIATVIAILLLLIAAGAFFFSRTITRPLIADIEFAQAISEGEFDAALKLDQKDELGKLARALNQMARKLQDQDWLRSGKHGIDDALRGELTPQELIKRFVTFATKHLDAQIGAVFLKNKDILELKASYAFTDRQGNFNRIKLGEGMVGQAAMEKEIIVFTDMSQEAPKYHYGVGELVPSNFIAAPILFESGLVGVLLIGSASGFSPLKRQFITQNIKTLAVLINAAKSRQMIQDLLDQAQQQQEDLRQANTELQAQTEALKESEAKLQVQQEELRVTNEELEEQTKALKESEAELEAQQEELRVTNEELEERTKALEEQTKAIRNKNEDLQQAQEKVRQKAKDLEIASKYKSEFLANMSHELRTPLNSILILSQLLARNKEDNLTEKQVESVQAIHSSGSDLLTLINEILDLSKVEAGKVELVIEPVALESLTTDLSRLYKAVSEEKGIGFDIALDPGLPETIRTDTQRLQQVLRNLLTNAFKFTEKGSVSLRISRPDAAMCEDQEFDAATMIAFSVKDDGIGIPKEKQAAIFQAFRQADGSTSRKYGGTGLGLSISKELARLLGGTIELQSEEGRGSVFTVLLPETYKESSGENPSHRGEEKRAEPAPVVRAPLPRAVEAAGPPLVDRDETADPPKGEDYLKDDRRKITPSSRSLLIIEDDRNFAKIMLDFARERGFHCVVAEDGETGLHFADYYKPSAIILDIGLPGIDGWTVMERLKENPETRHIPVHFISASDSTLNAMKMGAIGYLTKPVSMEKVDEAFGRIEEIISKPVSRLLLVEDDQLQLESIKALIGNGDVVTTAVRTGQEALQELEKGGFDCMILDLGLGDMSGFELLEKIRINEKSAGLPIIIYTGRDLTRDEEKELNRYAESIIIKGVKSPERLLDESALFLHRVEANLPEEKRKMLQMVHDKEKILSGKTILLADDDMRNVFALSSVLEEREMTVIVARDGQECLDKLAANQDVDAILMDIMMPKMDGYEAMETIRKQKKHANLPIIALTAKAMKGDRSKCIEAGASDYLAKPVNMDKLISMLRVWLY